MERDFLNLIREAEKEAAEKIEAAKIEAAEIEKSGIAAAEQFESESKAEWKKRKEKEQADTQYVVKKKYDNKKSLLTVSLNDTKLKAQENIDKAATLIVERIINS